MEVKEHLPVAVAAKARIRTKVVADGVSTGCGNLTGFHAGYFRISLSLCAQALLWKTLSEPSGGAAGGSHALRHLARSVPAAAHLLLWSVALAVLVALCFLYALRCAVRPRHVAAEFSHHVGVNYLFAPWISWLLLLQAAPPAAAPLSRALWWAFVAPILMLDVKIYGQWFTDGKRFLSLAANPTSQMTVVGNLVGAQAAARMGWPEAATCMFSLGMVHYLVLFVTLYQRFVGSTSLPAILRPAFFLFIAASSMASLAWDSIAGKFDLGSRMLFYLSLFLLASLVSRPALFRRAMRRFNLAWWAYSFPLTMLALAATEYEQEVKGGVADALMLFLSALSVLVITVLVVFTVLKAGDLFPNGDDPFAPPPPLGSSNHSSRFEVAC
ncbi:S-type anion channel SLAH1-like [Zingiber officinale]|uniref:S-type anion channel SLAH1-like n=1 Tax=Zingiber officinale TaxID=94328 RepID=UPI001C4C5A56|nr:S-type anion channel SLAH1-like [Zingiber officinale]